VQEEIDSAYYSTIGTLNDCAKDLIAARLGTCKCDITNAAPPRDIFEPQNLESGVDDGCINPSLAAGTDKRENVVATEKGLMHRRIIRALAHNQVKTEFHR